MPTVAQQLLNIRENIHTLEKRYGREKGSVTLLAVSKTRSSEEISEAVSQGQLDFGENYQQEALHKIAELQDKGISWHFIGPLQSNKAKAVAEHFSWVHSVDRMKIARRLSDLRPADQDDLQTCIQLNISAESSKSGIDTEQLEDFASELAQLPGLRLRGLMAMPAPESDFDLQRQAFSKLYRYYEKLNDAGFTLDTLSMGTSADMEAAIAEGATIIRIGTAIFGPRR